MYRRESSERLRGSAFGSRAASSYHTDTALPHQVYSDTVGSHEGRGQGQGRCEEEVSIQHGEEDDTSRLASTQSYGERSSMSAATFARSGGAPPASAQVERSVYTPHRTSPHASVALPFSVGPSIRLPASPAGCLRPSSLIAEDAASNPAAAAGGGRVTTSHPLPGVLDVKVIETDVVDPPFRSEIQCRICGLSVLRSDWEAHQVTTLHRRRLRECATACGSCSGSSSRPLTAVVQGSSISQPAAAAGFRGLQGPVVSGDAQKASSSATPSARAPALSRENPQERSQAAAEVERRPSSRPHPSRRKLDSASSDTASSMYSTSSSSTSSSSSGTRSISSSSAGSTRSRSAVSKGSAARGRSDVSAVPHATPPRPNGQPLAPAAPSSPTPSFVLPPLSPSRFSAASSASAAACLASLPVKALDSDEAAAAVHCAQPPEEEQERRRVRKLEKQLSSYLSHHEHKVLAACVRRWYEAMFTKATAPITDSDPPKRGGGAVVVASAPCSPRGCAGTSLSPETVRAHRVAVTSPSPPRVSEMVLDNVDSTPYEPGVSSAPHNSTSPAVSAAANGAAFRSHGQDNRSRDVAEERVDDGDRGSLSRRSNTQQPASPSCSMPHCGEDMQMNRPAAVGVKCAASPQVVDANPMHTEHAGVLMTRGEGEPTPTPFFTTCVKSYARVHVTADGYAFPAEVRCGTRDGSAESEAQDLEVMQTKVSWVVRPASRPAAARRSSSDSSDSTAARRDWRSAIGCSGAAVGAAAAAAAARGSTSDSLQPPANSPGVEAAWWQARGKVAGRHGNSRAQPRCAAKGARGTVSGRRPHLPQPHSAAPSNVAGYGRYGDDDGDVGARAVGDAAASEEPPEARRRRHRTKHHHSGKPKAEEWRSLSRKKRRGYGGDERAEGDCVSRRTQTPDEEEAHASAVHQPPHRADASGTEATSAVSAILYAGGKGGGCDSVERTGEERHRHKGTGDRREGKRESGQPYSSDSAATAATPIPSGEADASTEEDEGELCEPSPLTSEAAGGRHAVSTGLAVPKCNRSSTLDEASPRQSSNAPPPKAAASKRDPFSHAGALKDDHAKAASPSSSIALTGASGERSSSISSSSFSSPSSFSYSIGSDSDMAELAARLSPSTQQRAWQLLRPGSAPSLLAHSAGVPKMPACASDTQQHREPDLAAAIMSATQTLTSAFVAGQGNPAAQAEEEEQARLGYLPAIPFSASAPLMPQDVRGRGAAAATTPIADILSGVLTGVPGGDGGHAAASETGEQSAAHGPHHHLYRSHPRDANAAVQLPKTLLALHVMSAGAASSSVVAPPVDALDGRVSDCDGDAAQPPQEPSVSFVVNQASAEVGLLLPSSSGHPYNFGGPPCCGSGRGGHARAGPRPFLGATLVARQSGDDKEESSVAGMPSAERYDDVYLAYAHEAATTATHGVDEGRAQQGSGAPEEHATVGQSGNADDVLPPSSIPPTGLGVLQVSRQPSRALFAAVSERVTGAPEDASSAVQLPPSSFSTHALVEPGVAQSPAEGLRLHAVEVAQRCSATANAAAGPARDLHGVPSEGAATEGRRMLAPAGAVGADVDEGRRLVGGVAPTAAYTSDAEVAQAPSSLSSATGSGPTATRTGAGALVPFRPIPQLHKAVAEGPGAALPRTNQLLAASPFAFSSGGMRAANPADAVVPSSAPAQLHVDPLRGPMWNMDQAAKRRPLSLDQHTYTVAPTTSAAIESGGDASSWPPRPADGRHVGKTTSGTPHPGLHPTTASEAAGFSAVWRDAAGASGTALVRMAEPLNTPPCTTLVPCSRADGAGGFLYDFPSLKIPVLRARGDRDGLDEDPPQLARGRRLRGTRLSRGATAQAAVVTGSGNVPLLVPYALLPAAECTESSPETLVQPQQSTLDNHPPRPFRLPHLRDVEAGISNLGGNIVTCSPTQHPEAAEASALSGALAPASAGTAHTVSCLPHGVMPTTHPYCYATLKGAAGGEPSTKRDDRIAESELVATALRSTLAVRASLGEGLEDSALHHASASFTAVTPLVAAAASGLGAARDASPLSSSPSSYSHASPARVHPNRRPSHHRRHCDGPAASQKKSREERRKQRGSGQESRRDGDASLGHHRQHRHHRSGRRHEEDSNDETHRSQHRRHHRTHAKHRVLRHGRERPQVQDTSATAAQQAHLPLLYALEASPQQGLTGADCRDVPYVAQEAGKRLPSGARPPHPYRVAPPSAPVLPGAFGDEALTRGKDHYGQPAAPCSDDMARAARQRRSHRGGSSSAPHIRDGASDEDAALSRHLYRRPGERERAWGHRHRCRRRPSASVLSTSSSSSRSIGSSSGSRVSSGGDIEVVSAGPPCRGRAAARVSVPPSTAADVAREPDSGDVPGGKEEVGAAERSRSDDAAHSVEAPPRQPMMSIEAWRGERGAQLPSELEWGSAAAHGMSTRADVCVPEIRPSANARAGIGATSYAPVRGEAVDGKGARSVDSHQPPELAGSIHATVQESPAGDEDGVLLSRASSTAAPAGSAPGKHAPGAQAPCSGAHGSAYVSSAKLGRPRRPSADTATASTTRGQDAVDGQPAPPQHGDLLYRDSAGRFHRVNSAELPSVLAGEVRWRTSPEPSQSPPGSTRRPLYVVHNPAPSACAITGRQARRAWTITNPTNSLGCGRLNPYCSSCRAKYNLMFVDPQMRPVQWPSAQSAELDQMGDCRIHSGYIFGGGDTESKRDAMLVQQRLRSKRMAAWPELPHSGRDHLIVHEEDLDGPLRQLAPPPQGRFVHIAYAEDMRLPVGPALRRRAPLLAASAGRSFAFLPSSAALSQLPRHPVPGDASGDALRFVTSPAGERVSDCPPASSAHWYPSTIRSGTCSYDSYLRNPTRGRNSPHNQHKRCSSCNAKDVGSAPVNQLDKFAEVTAAKSRQPPPQSYPALETVGVAKRLVGDDAGATASTSAATSGMAAEPASVSALRQEERRIKKALKQLLWRDLPQQRGTAEWENYLRSLSEGLRQQPGIALSLVPPLPVQVVETVQASLIDSAAKS
ncbi:conserved hypothetical protein [Leishmania major strain Friedlin]|uniref:Uncharacterized protein n=1 Tax=Leishmania major TaxID=5664 RepID=E9ADQ4_LEIMA|nr:conserved hypothetical protein [Leishmania major strain Friedlin]CAG9577781.1 hypothetical_protein_-_conserved [Leishmania major strain Friedlin]CBZ12383.1 conserved hypothetical protein [Leishmania major strain Friedlin]|eukprot:XP_003722126.1 conserved hypothetical protein [Leishmania major strain Friedlin]